jgi:AcrR family transcriptional regulator
MPGAKRTSRRKEKTAEAATRERLLDAAEDLFGEHGFDGASVRAITAHARANLGAVTYHFGSKEELYLAAFFRRVRPVNERRLAELAALREARGPKQPLAVAEVLRCLLRGPLSVAIEHPGFVRLLARNLTQPPAFAAARIGREMDPLHSPFMVELARALPRLPPPVLAFRLMLTGGALFFLLNHWPLPGKAREQARGKSGRAAAQAAALPKLPPLPPELALELLVEFAAAGFAAPAPGPETLGGLFGFPPPPFPEPPTAKGESPELR